MSIYDVAAAALEVERIRQLRLAARRKRVSLACLEACEDLSPCYNGGADEWCANCLAAKPVYAKERALTHDLGLARKRMERRCASFLAAQPGHGAGAP